MGEKHHSASCATRSGTEGGNKPCAGIPLHSIQSTNNRTLVLVMVVDFCVTSQVL